jgi:hypothetical protein
MMNVGHTSSFMTAGIIVQHMQYSLPTSCTLFVFFIVVYIFLQDYKQLALKHIFEMRAIVYYNRYVDDILTIFTSTTIREEQIMNTINNI